MEERIAFAIISIGIGYIIKTLSDIRKEAKEGRKKLHEQMENVTNNMTQIQSFHKVNHPGQL